MEEAWDYGDEEEAENQDTGAVEDSTWKVRRGAVRVLEAIIRTRGELHTDLVSKYAVAIAERFKERVDLVKCDLFGAFRALAMSQGTSIDAMKKEKFAPIAE